MKDVLYLRPEELGGSTQRISILSKCPIILINALAVLVFKCECTSFKEVPNDAGRFNLPESIRDICSC